MADITLVANSKRYTGWQTMRLNRSIERLASSFELTVSDKNNYPAAQQLRHATDCRVIMNGHTVIIGTVDDLSPSYSAKNHTLTVAGRDRTGDLVDCSAVWPSGEWKKRNILQIATDLCKPFNVSVRTLTDVGRPFDTFTIQSGETVFETLSRAARMRALLLIGDALGSLLITRASTVTLATPLHKGKNILSASARQSRRDRFSTYTVKGQNSGTDFTTAEQNSAAQGQAVDPVVTRHRPLVIIAEDLGHDVTLKQRAQWEANVKSGQAERATVTVQGWEHEHGLWQPNFLVNVDDDYINIKGRMLIVATKHIFDDQGSRCELTLCRPGAFDILPMKEEASGWG